MDGFERELDGFGHGLAGVIFLYDVAFDWRVGLEIEVAAGGDVRMIGVGPTATFQFAMSDDWKRTAETGSEHLLTASMLWHKLDVDESDFGDFRDTVGFKIGYMGRFVVMKNVTVNFGGGYRIAFFKYKEDVASGDDDLLMHGPYVMLGASITF
ncbi:MAG: hypothetical protein ACYTAF_14645, partial [Planctomycetota bacterium]|jgi:hypothetical protein